MSGREKRYREAIEWALGSRDRFPLREDGDGLYWWRTELLTRAGLKWDMDRGGYIDKAECSLEEFIIKK